MARTLTTAEEDALREELDGLRVKEILNRRDEGHWGDYHPDDSTRSDPRVREVNRYLTELKERRNLAPVVGALWATLVAIFIGTLALPVKDSVLAQTLGSEVAALRGIQIALGLYVIGAIYLFRRSYVWLRPVVKLGPRR